MNEEEDSIYSVKPQNSRLSVEKKDMMRNKYNRRQRNQRNRIVSRIIIFIVVLIAIILFFITSIFGSVVVKLELDSLNATVDNEFSAAREVSNLRDIKYRKVGPIVYEGKVVIPTTKSKPRVTKAVGTLTVYNTNKSGVDLRLIKNTRFTLQDNRIYRLGQAVTVPGGRTSGGKFQAGSIDVTVVSDVVGLQSNVDQIGTRFSIPGLSSYGDYKDSYALSKTKISGGFSGQKYIIDDEIRKEEEKKLRQQIKNKLEEKLQIELDQYLPTKWIVFDDGKFFDYDKAEENDSNEAVELSIKGSIQALALPERDLAELIAKDSGLIDDDNNQIRLILESKEGLNFLIIDRSKFDIDTDKEILFSLSGETKIQFDIDEVLLFASTAGKNREEFNIIIKSEYTYVRDSQLDFFPFWKTTIPYSNRRFEVEKVYK